MRTSNKSRSRNKNNNRRNSVANVVNRVFDSSGPEGKVRGTPQQVIEKYTVLARDAQLSGDRINAENFAQHAEHYQRLLSEAQREAAERQRQQDEQREKQQAKARAEDGSQDDEPDTDSSEADPLATAGPEDAEDSLVIDTPESVESSEPEEAKAS
ncbi:MAG: DUF4167 domain-containing protein [Pseudomonadota bacterium]